MHLAKEIVVRSEIEFAARELSETLAQITGVVPRQDGEGFPITVRSRGGESEGYRITIAPDGIDILGGSVRGAVYGMYDFLERDLGCRFWAEDCRWIPKGFDGELEPGTRTEAPAFPYREYIGAGRWMAGLRSNAA